MEKIKLSDRQTVYLTSAAGSVRRKERKAGDAIERHPKQAEALIAAGKATKEPGGKPAKGGVK